MCSSLRFPNSANATPIQRYTASVTLKTGTQWFIWPTEVPVNVISTSSACPHLHKPPQFLEGLLQGLRSYMYVNSLPVKCLAPSRPTPPFI